MLLLEQLLAQALLLEEKFIYFLIVTGNRGIAGIILSSTLTGLIIYRVLKQIKHQEIENYHQYIETIGMKLKTKEIANSIINIFLLISFYIMVAGFSAYFEQQWGLSQILTGLIMMALCYITFLYSIEGITKINTILIPTLIAIIILLGIKSTAGNVQNINIVNLKENWIIASVEYASYNSILLIPILISLKKYSYQHEKSIAISSSMIFFILAFILYKIQQTSPMNIKEIQLPLIHILSQYGNLYQYILRRCYHISNFYFCYISRIRIFTKLYEEQKTI